MTKKYYQSLLSFRFSFFLTAPAIVIFILGFMKNSANAHKVRLWMGVMMALLVVVMFFYYKTKLQITNALKKIPNPDAFYEEGGMVHQSMILEERMLIAEGFHLFERKTDGISRISLLEEKRKLFVKIEQGDIFLVECDSKDQAERFAAFLKRKNPHLEMTGLVPKGNGTLKELGAGAVLQKEEEDEDEW